MAAPKEIEDLVERFESNLVSLKDVHYGEFEGKPLIPSYDYESLCRFLIAGCASLSSNTYTKYDSNTTSAA